MSRRCEMTAQGDAAEILSRAGTRKRELELVASLMRKKLEVAQDVDNDVEVWRAEMQVAGSSTALTEAGYFNVLIDEAWDIVSTLVDAVEKVISDEQWEQIEAIYYVNRPEEDEKGDDNEG